MMAAIVGAAGLESTLAAVRQGAIVGLANKETLVCAGDLFMGEIDRRNATLVPVDSEHSAIFQVFETDHASHVERIEPMLRSAKRVFDARELGKDIGETRAESERFKSFHLRLAESQSDLRDTVLRTHVAERIEIV